MAFEGLLFVKRLKIQTASEGRRGVCKTTAPRPKSPGIGSGSLWRFVCVAGWAVAFGGRLCAMSTEWLDWASGKERVDEAVVRRKKKD